MYLTASIAERNTDVRGIVAIQLETHAIGERGKRTLFLRVFPFVVMSNRPLHVSSHRGDPSFHIFTLCPISRIIQRTPPVAHTWPRSPFPWKSSSAFGSRPPRVSPWCCVSVYRLAAQSEIGHASLVRSTKNSIGLENNGLDRDIADAGGAGRATLSAPVLERLGTKYHFRVLVQKGVQVTLTSRRERRDR